MLVSLGFRAPFYERRPAFSARPPPRLLPARARSEAGQECAVLASFAEHGAQCINLRQDNQQARFEPEWAPVTP